MEYENIRRTVWQAASLVRGAVVSGGRDKGEPPVDGIMRDFVLRNVDGRYWKGNRGCWCDALLPQIGMRRQRELRVLEEDWWGAVSVKKGVTALHSNCPG